MRVWTECVYGILPEQVIGTSIKVKFESRNGKRALIRLHEIDFIDDKAGKPMGIQMLQWTAAGSYDRQSPIGRPDKAPDEAQVKGRTVVDMKRHWKRVLPFENRRDIVVRNRVLHLASSGDRRETK